MDAISGVRITFADPVGTVDRTTREDKGGFSGTLANAMEQVETLRTDAQQQISSLLAGNGGELHSTMISVEKADVAFELMMQVRNKIVAAYQEVAHMQV
jgi:flagellar hook-basal body complex protein FliE